jgi:hypothetical protein
MNNYRSDNIGLTERSFLLYDVYNELGYGFSNQSMRRRWQCSANWIAVDEQVPIASGSGSGNWLKADLLVEGGVAGLKSGGHWSRRMNRNF